MFRKIGKLNQTKFSKLEITRAMRQMPHPSDGEKTLEDYFIDDLLPSNTQAERDWNNAVEIDLSDPVTIAFLDQANLDIDAIIIKIGTLS